ncbi:Beta-glucosidase B [Neonectria ditissima]|uniref:beta-glucosidase n=1 Tax=Neonectria ditissima TaxID=78410 RepID=A0A0P7BJT5_9HYPO|nr:Beta-glucosidase B [Neonectria ditissima]
MPSSDVETLLGELSLEEKVSLLSGADIWQTQEVSRLGIGSIKVFHLDISTTRIPITDPNQTTDGPSGARGKYAVDGPSAAFLPGPVCQAATWSKTQMRDLGRLLCREAKTKAAHILLAPTICCARNPLGGRNFECFGEDPFLSGALAVEYIHGVQETGEVSATAKHFVANEQEFERFSIDAQISERALREIYLKPFEMVVKSQSPPDCIMTSYNVVNGEHMDMNAPIIQGILREEWGFKGLVMSDWGGTNSTIQSLVAGLDLEMPGPPEKRGSLLLKAIEENPTKEVLEALDTSVSRVLSLAHKFHLLGLSPELAKESRDREEISSTTKEDTKLLREIAASGIVLLKNSRQTLPLDLKQLAGKQVAFIGPNALLGTPGGGGSASMNPQYLSRPMESFKAVAKEQGVDLSVKYALGAQALKWLPLFEKEQWTSDTSTVATGKSMVQIDFFASTDLSGPISETQFRNSSNIDLSDSAPLEFQVDPIPPYSFRVSSSVVPLVSGKHSFSLSSVGASKLYVNGELVVDNSNWQQLGETFYAFGSAECVEPLFMEAGKSYKVSIEGWVNKDTAASTGPSTDANHVFSSNPSVRIGFSPPVPNAESLIAEAVTLCDESEATVVVLGLSDEWESEGYDRQSMALPGDQDKLVTALLQRTKRPESLIFVNQSGSPVELPWIDRVSTFLQAWYGGQEAGNALADVIFGTVNPSGRLPITWPRRYSDLPFSSDPQSWPGVDGKVIYKEEIQVGYRWYRHQTDIRPQWWFGYGLSYTDFTSTISSISSDDEAWGVSVTVENSGNMAGQDVVQLYVWKKGQQQEMVLAGFEKTATIHPLGKVTVDVVIRKREVACWVDGKWLLAEGDYIVAVSTGAGHASEVKKPLLQGHEKYWI